ncbi:MAG: hypothetical protein ACT4SY_04190 [Hyphomicrobiales bacterium]
MFRLDLLQGRFKMISTAAVLDRDYRASLRHGVRANLDEAARRPGDNNSCGIVSWRNLEARQGGGNIGQGEPAGAGGLGQIEQLDGPGVAIAHLAGSADNHNAEVNRCKAVEELIQPVTGTAEFADSFCNRLQFPFNFERFILFLGLLNPAPSWLMNAQHGPWAAKPVV